MTDLEERTLQSLCAESRYETAYRTLVDRLSAPMYRLALRMGLNHDDAQDVLQEAFISIWKALPKFRGDSKFSTWVYRIVSNEALAALRKQQRRRLWTVPQTEAPEAAALGQADAPFFDADETLRQLHRAQSLLPEKQRLVFQLRYFDELPYSDIAAITGTSEGGLKANYHHAVQKIRSYLQQVKPETTDDLLQTENP